MALYKVTFNSFCSVFDALIRYNTEVSESIKLEWKNKAYINYKEDPMKGKTPRLWMEWFYEDLDSKSVFMLKSRVCEKSGCNRVKLKGNVYCSYHYEVNFS